MKREHKYYFVIFAYRNRQSSTWDFGSSFIQDTHPIEYVRSLWMSNQDSRYHLLHWEEVDKSMFKKYRYQWG